MWYCVHQKNCLKLLYLSRNLDKNRNIFGLHLYKDNLHFLESGKKKLANNFIFNLNNFLSHPYKHIILINR